VKKSKTQSQDRGETGPEREAKGPGREFPRIWSGHHPHFFHTFKGFEGE